MPFPPGPRLPPTLQSLAIYVRPAGWTEWCRRRYGSVFTLRDKVMGRLVCIADPELIKVIFKGDPNVFKATHTPLESVFGPDSVVVIDGDRHRRMRRLLQPSFHGDSVRHYNDLTAEVTKQEVKRWPVGEPFPLAERSESITLDVIVRALFGSDAEHLDELRELTPRLIAPNPAIFVDLLRHDFGPWSPWGRFLRLHEAYDALVYDEIKRRRSQLEGGTAQDSGDILSRLLAARDEEGRGLSDGELRDQLVSLLVAGSEAVATGVDWAFERLLRHPHVLDRLKAELAAGDEEYLDAVVRETLRIRPVVMAATRTLGEDTKLNGYQLPAGTVLFIGVALVHHSKDLYTNPLEFRPERFLGQDPEPFAWLGFGGGVRRCMGANFAWPQMKVMIATILELAELDVHDRASERVKISGPILKPAKGATVVLKRRLAPAS